MRNLAVMLSLTVFPLLARAQLSVPASDFSPSRGSRASGAPALFVMDEFGFDTEAYAGTDSVVARPARAPSPKAAGGALIAAGILSGVLGSGVLAASSLDKCDPDGYDYGPCSDGGSSGTGQFLGGVGLVGGLILIVSGAMTMSIEP